MAKVKPKQRELVFSLTKKDFVVTTFRCGGNGGQNVNKLETGVRIAHLASGAIAESREERTQGQNKKIAFKRLTEMPIFKLWVERRCHEIATGETTEQWVDRQLTPENLLIEAETEKGWEHIDG